ncbi:MAG TPA: cbb3-type cytochrome c oxidase subunit I, partial [Chryseolinea sp.]
MKLIILTTLLMLITAGISLWIVLHVLRKVTRLRSGPPTLKNIDDYLRRMNENEIALVLAERQREKQPVTVLTKSVLTLFFVSIVLPASAQSIETPSLISQPGIIITLVLILIPIFIAVLLLILRINKLVARYQAKVKLKEAERIIDELIHREDEEIDAALLKRKASLSYVLTNNELSGSAVADDKRGLIKSVNAVVDPQFVATKRKVEPRPSIDRNLARLILWYLGCATFWLLFGTSVGEYLGIKFVAPDVDSVSWLSFGRLRPVHTNAVFWGWSSLAMLGLGYYVVPTVSNASIASMKSGWISLWLINASIILGTLCLMAGINNAGGEYREYVWPVMMLFAAGLVVTLINFMKTVARRKTKEIYISNWYIISAILFTLVIAIVAYWPTWQNGLGETITQGYYMHQGVGMWFMLFNLGLVYYFLPQQLNKPIYSYSLGILAFWTQILFYTLIGTHHFIFSSIPWWLQTVAIVGSMGMLIPVTAGTTNFFMTFKGTWNKISNSYTLPFYLVGIVFYFVGSFQGTAEAFRFTNLLWHFTDFTVAHSHLTMYGIIAFLLWASIYSVVPRLTGHEPSQLLTGAHFWLAFLGLLIYTIPLMICGTLKGFMWMEGKPFIERVV